MSAARMGEFSAGSQTVLNPDIARSNPDLFVYNTLQALRESSDYGGSTLDYVLNTAPRMWLYPGDRSNIEIDVDPSGWTSSSNIGNGTVRLGAGSMSREEMDRVRFLDNQFDYNKNVAYRFSHEAHHFIDAIARRQNTPAMRALDQATQGIRRANNGQRGLSALGSMGFYQSQGIDVMSGEDRTELMTMYTWSPAYFDGFWQIQHRKRSDSELVLPQFPPTKDRHCTI